MAERHVDTFQQLGFSIDITHPKFPEKAVLSEEIISFTGTKNQNWIGIAPFAHYESKVYPQDLMQHVIDALAENKNNYLFLFGGGATEIQKLQQLQNKHDNVIVVAGKLAFEAEIQLISNLDVMLSMDSGNSHIAAMLGVKVITLWGATHPYAGFKPFNQPDAFCLTADRTQYPLLPTSIYGNKKVKGYDEVMRTILPSQVVEKINSNLT
jgi:ADP-heptose:LPS heptosyltransferase